jgi:ATP-dependent Clp protease ATP-binding subunit ClpB
MSSNIGSHIIQKNLENITDKNKSEVMEATRREVFALLKSAIRPEFLNRIDEIIMFSPLNQNEITEIVRLQFEQVKKLLADNQVQLSATDDAIAYLANEGYDPQYGARPVKRVIQKNLLNELSKMILSGKVDKDSEIVLILKGNQLVFTNKK